ncbi:MULTISPECIES: MZA anti-phage system associated PD-(D/E)XK motif protein MzaD [Aeromonas]|uniref:MZA anti-phage system associated PD-(D/E)XK motif protein MzaD n=1 Tax=Aeromonas TaxID=642 RepID=UPI0020B811FF|nr:MZA anti-phage system associated PD-(D/E)XK motif protein MzaD [Aeromonas caviae]EKP0247193.1 PD-(D/E)XK motif protein [Aeromonas veronii]MCY9810021.1 PD-(D/E)XK motif protein [Aeromonas caviae]MDX7613173.1 MZA anti-phage system associated PD-(D/E)XK motif protein MzaD [Aeromonas caviae]MDX7689526.1 MZA anti-phage system associated PD-(D/E)XK motif protein MzaD [Aeromonas caviae]MDX7736479.1 MZA anti-phage system associated PD-(D/E)XK motif protein MzaD [Aeromonas caviae]
MDLLSKEDILGTWRALSGVSNEDVWRTILLVPEGVCTLRAGRCFPGNEEGLLVRFGNGYIGSLHGLPAATGFTFKKIKLGNNNEEWLALVRQPGGNLDLFATVVTDLVAVLLGSSILDGRQLLNIFMKRLRAWMSFMKKGATMLGPEAELGLVGELQCMSTLLAAGCSAESVVEGWTGPMDGLQDFQLGHGAIEVKSTLAKDGFSASILSLEQLDDSVRKPLFLCACRFSVDPSGVSLPVRIASLKEQMDEATAVVFGFALLHAGYLDAHADLYTRQFVEVSTRYMLIDETFPRLTGGNVPVGVVRAKYEIELDAIDAKECLADAAIEMIGMN